MTNVIYIHESNPLKNPYIDRLIYFIALEDLADGRWKIVMRDGLETTDIVDFGVKDGKLHGKCKVWWWNGGRIRTITEFDKGKRVGTCALFRQDGSFGAYRKYKNGIITGFEVLSMYDVYHFDEYRHIMVDNRSSIKWMLRKLLVRWKDRRIRKKIAAIMAISLSLK